MYVVTLYAHVCMRILYAHLVCVCTFYVCLLCASFMCTPGTFFARHECVPFMRVVNVYLLCASCMCTFYVRHVCVPFMRVMHVYLLYASCVRTFHAHLV